MFDYYFKPLNDFSKQVTAWKDNDVMRRVEMLIKAYPASAIGKILKNDEFWVLANQLPDTLQTKLINTLATYEKMGDWGIKINKFGKFYEYYLKVASPVKTMVSETLKTSTIYQSLTKNGALAGKVLGKVATVTTYADLAVTGVSSAFNEYGKTKSVGKAVIGGTIDTIKSVGPLEGATIGATIGGMFGTAIPVPFLGTISGATLGAAAGFAVGLFNSGIQVAFPKIYDDAKKLAYKGIDAADKAIATVSKEVGKGIKATVDTISQTFGGIGKALGFG